MKLDPADIQSIAQTVAKLVVPEVVEQLRPYLERRQIPGDVETIREVIREELRDSIKPSAPPLDPLKLAALTEEERKKATKALALELKRQGKLYRKGCEPKVKRGKRQ